jgi:hypothetical protein
MYSETSKESTDASFKESTDTSTEESTDASTEGLVELYDEKSTDLSQINNIKGNYDFDYFPFETMLAVGEALLHVNE